MMSDHLPVDWFWSNTSRKMFVCFIFDCGCQQVVDDDSEPIPLPNVNSSSLKRILTWIGHHQVSRRPASHHDCVWKGGEGRARRPGQGPAGRRRERVGQNGDSRLLSPLAEGATSSVALFNPVIWRIQIFWDFYIQNKHFVFRLPCNPLNYQMKLGVVVDLLMASNYLDIGGLVVAASKIVANMIAGKSPEQIRKTFYIEDDLTAEQKGEIIREHGVVMRCTRWSRKGREIQNNFWCVSCLSPYRVDIQSRTNKIQRKKL